jgi:hypothetical protein
MVNSSELLKGVSIAVITVLLALTALELGLRSADIPPEPQFGWKWDRSPYKSDSNVQDNRVNQLGLRGRQIAYDDNDFVIILLGDSYTEAGAHEYENMPEQMLERLLRENYGFDNVRVFSVASAGWGQDQELLWLEAYFSRFRADLVLMWITPINDYWENGNVDRSVLPTPGPLKQTFKLSENNLELAYPRQHAFKLRLLLEKALANLRYGREASLERFYVTGWLEKLPPSNLTPISRLFCPPIEIEQLDVVAAFQNGEARVTLVTTEDLTNGRSHFSHFLIPSSRRELYQIDITHRLIEEAANLSSKHNAQFRMFYPKGSDIDRALGSVKCVKDKVSGSYFLTDFSDLTYDIRHSQLRGMLLTLDISSSAPNGISSSDWHLNMEGNRSAMDVLAKRLLASGLLPAKKTKR